ncbi:MAG TPA: UbiA family prenyltransferase, partial [Bacillota bacterium]|nr:UbiA family prenyltransferase [Bacillota bacterium]
MFGQRIIPAISDHKKLKKFLASDLTYGILMNFIDLKDVKGDRAAGVPTLPVILGMRAAQWTLAVLFVAFYPLVPLLVGDLRLLWACVPAGLLSAVIVLRRHYGPRHDRALIL